MANNMIHTSREELTALCSMQLRFMSSSTVVVQVHKAVDLLRIAHDWIEKCCICSQNYIHIIFTYEHNTHICTQTNLLEVKLNF